MRTKIGVLSVDVTDNCSELHSTRNFVQNAIWYWMLHRGQFGFTILFFCCSFLHVFVDSRALCGGV